jgi:RNA polymerase sigma-70 factor (ECF subfamily)
MSLEEQIRGLLDKGDLHGAATEAVEGYGPEVLGFLATLVRDPRDASEVFSQTCEDLWTGLARFQGRSSMRTWLYTLARHAAARFRRAPHRRPGRRASLSEASGLAESVRMATLRYLRTDVKDRFAQIRDSLDERDRTLLVLRVDRGMAWKEIATVLSPEDESDEMLDREAARLRKRFQLVKDQIRVRARQAGLLPEDSRGPGSPEVKPQPNSAQSPAGTRSPRSEMP